MARRPGQDERRLKIVHDLYTADATPALFGNERDLRREAAKRGVPARYVRDYLQNFSRTYSRHKQTRRRFTRAATRAEGVGTRLQLDLADMSALADANSGRRWILVGWDTFSRRLYGVAMQRKRPRECVRAFRSILRAMRPMRPWIVTTDGGTEFLGDFADYLWRMLIEHRLAPHSPQKTAGAERGIRSLKTRLAKFMTEHRTRRWLPALPRIVAALNAQPKRALGNRRPIDVTAENEHEGVNEASQRTTSAAAVARPPHQFAYDVAQRVRVLLDKASVGYKGYKRRYTEAVFEIDARVKNQRVPAYRLRTSGNRDDDGGRPVRGIFYAHELVSAGAL